MVPTEDYLRNLSAALQQGGFRFGRSASWQVGRACPEGMISGWVESTHP